MAGIEFKVDAVLGGSTQVQDLINKVNQGAKLNIDNRQALQSIQAVQRQVDALIQSINNIPAIPSVPTGGGGGQGGGGGGNNNRYANALNARIESITENDINGLYARINDELDGTVQRIQVVRDAQGQIVSGTVQVSDGISQWTRNLEFIDGQFTRVVASGRDSVSTIRQQNDLYGQARSLISQIGKVEKQQIGTHGQVRDAYQQQLNYLNQQLMTLMQQDNFNDLLSADQRQELSNLAYEVQLERQITAEKLAQRQAEADLRNFGTVQTNSVNAVNAQGINDVNSMRSALEQVGVVWDNNTKAVGNYSETTNSAGQAMAILTTETKTLDANGNEVFVKQQHAINKVTGEYRKLDEGVRQVVNTQRSLTQQIKDQAVHMLSQMVVSTVFNSIANSIRGCIDYVIDLDEAMTNIRVVTMGTREEAEELLDTYNKLGQELGASTTDIAEGAVDWLRQGFSEADTAELVKDSTILSKLALIDNAQATEYLTSALKGYKLEAQDAIGVIDQLVSIDLEAATSSADLAEGMSRTANMARTTGVEMNELLGMIATMSEVTQNSASTVGNSMKTVFSRMSNVAAGKEIDEMGESLNDVEKSLNNVGIKLRSSENEWYDFYDVLDSIASKWDEFNGVQQSQITTALGGKQKIFAKCLNTQKCVA